MAKKKKGWKAPKSKGWTAERDGTFIPDYTKKEQLTALLQWYQQQTLASVRSAPRETRDQMRMLDMDELWIKRRTEAVKRTMPEMCGLASKICPTAPGKFYVEEDWGRANYAPITSYDGLDNNLDLTMCAAIWMLDHIKAVGHIQEAVDWLDGVEEIPFAIYEHASVYDAVHNEYTLNAMMAAIRYRNKDCIIPAEYEKYREEGKTFTDIVTVLNKQYQNVPSRLIFQGLLDLINKADIQAAVDQYKSKIYEWTTNYFRARAVLRKEEIAWEQHKDRLAEGCNRNPRIVPVINGKPVRQLPLNGGLVRGTAVLNSTGTKGPAFDPYLNDEFLLSEIKAVDDEYQTMMDRLEHFVFKCGDVFISMESELRESYGDEIADIICDFKIEDPYAICFAILYLLDSGDDLPWLYFPGNSVAAHVRKCLPWTRVLRTDAIEDEQYEDWLIPSDDDSEPHDHVEKSETQHLDMFPDLYDLKYSFVDASDPDESGEECPVNLAQIVYSLSGGILPRNLHRYDGALHDLEVCGITDKATQAQILAGIMLLGESQFKEFDRYLAPSSCNEEYETWLDNDHDDVDTPEVDPTEEESVPEKTAEQYEDEIRALKKELTAEQYEDEIRALKKELEQQKQLAYEASKAKRDLQGKYDALVEQNDFERKELAELREVVYNIEQQQTNEKPVQEEEISFPYTVKHTIVVFGGHDTWAKAIKPMFDGDIRFIFRDKLPDDNLIRHADMVWVQTNCISHPNHWKISRAAQAGKVPVHHFAFASAEKCARQIIEADKALDSTNS